jgi:hypothetical protein
MGPGPIYDKPPAIESRLAGIGVKPRAKTQGKPLPGPADYFKTPIPPKDLPFCGFYGPTDRLELHLEKEVEKPGPGYYEQRGQFEKFRRGFYFTSRTMDDYVPDSDGSYVPQISGLGGPKWTIGAKDA